jgi:hypothetical protein
VPVALPVALSIAAAVAVLFISAVVLLSGAAQVAGPARLRREPGHPAEEAAVARARQFLRGHG